MGVRKKLYTLPTPPPTASHPQLIGLISSHLLLSAGNSRRGWHKWSCVLFFQIANGQQISPRSFCWFTVFNEILVPWIGWIGAWNRCKGKIQDIKFISEGRSKELINQTERISLAVRGYVKPLAEFCWCLLDVLTLIFWEYGPLTI